MKEKTMRKAICILSLTAIAVVTLAGDALAQRRGGGGGGGHGGGHSGWSSGHSGNWHGNDWHGGTSIWIAPGFGYFGGWGGGYWGSPSYYGYDYWPDYYYGRP